jgi:hypothetical protein
MLALHQMPLELCAVLQILHSYLGMRRSVLFVQTEASLEASSDICNPAFCDGRQQEGGFRTLSAQNCLRLSCPRAKVTGSFCDARRFLPAAHDLVAMRDKLPEDVDILVAQAIDVLETKAVNNASPAMLDSAHCWIRAKMVAPITLPEKESAANDVFHANFGAGRPGHRWAAERSRRRGTGRIMSL